MIKNNFIVVGEMDQYLITLSLQSWWPEDLSSVPSTDAHKVGHKGMYLKLNN